MIIGIRPFYCCSPLFIMNRSRFFHTFLFGVGLLMAGRLARAGDANEGWKETGKQGNITLYEKERTGTGVKEVRAVGVFDSPNWMVRNVLDDVEHYPQFMPYVIQSKIIERDPVKHTILTYAQINPPVVSNRDYTILIHDESRPGPEAGQETYVSRWVDGSDKGPAEKKGFVRVKKNEGSWVLEPIDGGQHTRATYTLFTDGGGGIPAFLLNSLNRRRLTELYDIVRSRVLEQQYREKKPVLP